jgi:hypothetical protein
LRSVTHDVRLDARVSGGAPLAGRKMSRLAARAA